MKTARIVALRTLGVLGVSALMGGIPMVLDPSGKMLQMPLSLLGHSPFHDFLIPGIILTACIGLLGLVIFAVLLER